MECIAYLMKRDGYMVMGSQIPRKIGERVPDRFSAGFILEISGLATEEDALRQFRLIEEFSGQELMPPPLPAHFYKTVMVAQ